MPPPEAAQEGAQGGWRLDHAAENTDRPTSTQRIGVVDEVAARQRGSDQRQQFVPRVRPPRGAAEVEVMADEFPQAQVLCKGGRQEQAGIGHQAVVVKDDADTVGIVLWQHLLGAPCFRVGFCFKTILPDSEEHPLASSRTVPKVVFRWIRVKEGKYALNWTRLSCHRFVANQVRLALFILAYNLGNLLRRLCLPRAVKHWSLRSLQVKLIKIRGEASSPRPAAGVSASRGSSASGGISTSAGAYRRAPSSTRVASILGIIGGDEDSQGGAVRLDELKSVQTC